MAAQKWRKRPVTVEVLQWTGTNLEEMREWVGPKHAHALNVPVMMGRSEAAADSDLHLRQQDGTLRIKLGEFLVKDPDGSLYKVTEGVLSRNYTLVEKTDLGELLLNPES